MVIDELIVVLGLDARKFTEGQREAVSAFKKGKEGATDFAKHVEEQGSKMAEALGIVKAGVMGVIGGFVGGQAAQFIKNIAESDAATGRWAKTIGTSVENLSKWQGMISQIGGSAESATSTLSALQQEINNVRQGGGMFEGGFASLMNQAGVSLRDDADTSLRKIRAFIAGQIESGKMKPDEAATFLRRVPGMNPEMLNLILMSTKAFNDLGDAVDNVGAATKRSAEAGAQLQTSWSKLSQAITDKGRSFMALIAPYLSDYIDATTKDISTPKTLRTDYGSGASWWGAVKQGFAWRPASPDPAADEARKKLAEELRARAARAAPAAPAGAGTRGDRNNNPGNMEYGPFARAHGATGSDGRFAVFPDWQTGAAAQQALVSGSGYAGLTLHEFAKKYAEGAPAWERTVGAQLGIGPGDVVNNKDPRLVEAIRRAEGTGARGSAAARAASGGNRTSTSTSEVSIGKVEIHAPNAKDADDIAGEIAPALKRQSLIAPVNTGLY